MSRARRRRRYKRQHDAKKNLRDALNLVNATVWGRSLFRDAIRRNFELDAYARELLNSMSLTTCAPADLDRIAALIGAPR